jgi:hypothetical protein
MLLPVDLIDEINKILIRQKQMRKEREKINERKLKKRKNEHLNSINIVKSY